MDDSDRYNSISAKMDDSDRHNSISAKMDDSDRHNSISAKMDDSDRHNSISAKMDDSDRHNSISAKMDDSDRHNSEKVLAQLKEVLEGHEKVDQRLLHFIEVLEKSGNQNIKLSSGSDVTFERISQRLCSEIQLIFEKLFYHVEVLQISFSRGFRPSLFLDEDIYEFHKLSDYISSKLEAEGFHTNLIPESQSIRTGTETSTIHESR